MSIEKEMQMLPREVAGGRKSAGRGKASSHYKSPRFRINNQIMWVVVLVNFLAPFFFGSDRPILWLIWAIVLGSAGTVWFFRLAIADLRMRVVLRSIRTIALGFAVLALYMIVQILPLGAILPDVHSMADPSRAIVSGTISLTPGNTVLALMRWLSYGLLFFFVLQISANQSRSVTLSRLLFWCIAAQAAVSIVLLYQFGDTIFGIPKVKFLGAATGGFLNRNSFATFLAFGSILGVVHLLDMTLGQADGGGGKRKPLTDILLENNGIVLFAVGWLVIIVALIATASRMGVLAAGCGILAVLILAMLKMPVSTRTKTIRATVMIVPIVLGAGIFLYGGNFIDRIGELDTTTDVSTRVNLYKQVWQMIESRFLLGFGGDSFAFAYPLFHQLPVQVEYTWDRAHSIYLALWSDYGLVFGSIPLLMVGYVFFKLVASHMRIVLTDPVLLAAIGVIVTAAIHSLVDFSLEIEAVTFMFVSILAAGYARYCEAAGRQKETTS